MSHRFHRPDEPLYLVPRELPRGQSGYLPDGCAYRLIPIVTLLAIVVFVALALHPQGFPLIPWLIAHL